ncbi:MAG: metallophosphoesterase [Burkholderiales bacterium]|nr:metallophosphoesterase [Burkholderiales bacterium]
MKLQVLSDLHLETELFTPQPAPHADLLVLAGDVDSTWAGLARFADWPVPVIFVPGNHEFDQRDIDEARQGLRERCDELGLIMLERDSCVMNTPDGRRLRFVGTTRWSDFDVFGREQRDRAMRAASYYVRVMRATRGGQVFDPEAVRVEALACRDWLADTLAQAAPVDACGRPEWDRTIAITHYGPSLRSADPRYGSQPGTASFCNADDDLLALTPIWIHGHLHCRHDYVVSHAQGGQTRVVSNARGHGHKGESDHFNGLYCIEA